MQNAKRSVYQRFIGHFFHLYSINVAVSKFLLREDFHQISGVISAVYGLYWRFDNYHKRSLHRTLMLIDENTLILLSD